MYTLVLTYNLIVTKYHKKYITQIYNVTLYPIIFQKSRITLSIRAQIIKKNKSH